MTIKQLLCLVSIFCFLLLLAETEPIALPIVGGVAGIVALFAPEKK